ncbi:tetratricopeptide repeat protein [Thioalbus denitrificans]|uniref:Tetratricopeptide repeat protein n=1 Tax=Thioalbus denitrificans TaxID=547122 RepID=A0A369C4X3_9GAMM|nr:tetratricopeptide repeat protein [Thioalbus denitrificans]RCX28098.1 tetratricopeptide repeat protein [Thioalbus denitrificans]
MGGAAGTRRVAAVAAGLVMLAGAASPGFAQQRIKLEDFLASPAASAFKAQDFTAALDGFRNLLSTYPDDPLVLRYIGITLDRLKRYDEAVAAFGEALRVAPGDPAILFFLGVSEYNRAGFGAAEEAFAAVAAEAPDTDYGARAREFLAALTANTASRTAPAARKPWDAYAQFGLQYDDNVGAAPDGTDDRDSLGSFEYLSFGYNLVNDDEWVLRAEASGYFSQHWQHGFDSQDVQFIEAAASLDHAAALGGVSVVPSLRYGLTGTYLEGDELVIGHRLAVAADIGWTSSLKTDLFYRAAIDDYEDEGFQPVVTSRDGVTHEAGVTQYFLFETFGRESRLSLGYRYKHRDADGMNHDSRTHTVSAGLSLALPEAFTLEFSGYVGRDEYPDFQGNQGERETDIRGGSIALSRPISDRLSASLSYSHRREDSNYTILDYDRNIVTFVLGYSF